MKKYLFIAEKTSVMNAVKEACSHNRREVETKLGAIDFVALSGHVCRYCEPDEYKQWEGKRWHEVDYPMIPDPFVVTTIDTKEKKARLSALRSAIKDGNYDGIIVGTDSDTEGNGIYYLVCEVLKLHRYQTLRFFEQSLTEKEVLDSLFHMTDFYREPRDTQMTEAYLVRSHADWLIGMNATRSLTVKTGALLRVGRVKAPTLKLVYDNSKAIDNFVPHSDYLVKASYVDGFTGVYADGNNPVAFETPEAAQAFIDAMPDTTFAEVMSVERKEKKTPPPKLYNLAAIQAEAGKKFGYTPSGVQDIIQSLYEKRLVSYPRTDGEYISSEKARSFDRLLRSASSVSALAPYISAITPETIARVQRNKNVVNDAEVQKKSHDALLPTDLVPDMSKLSQDERNIYDTICRRLVAQFMPDLVEEKTVLNADIGGYPFKSNGTTVRERGWTELYDRQNKGETIPPEITNGSVLMTDSVSPYEKKSTPPKRLTQATLIDAMRHIEKYIGDKALKQTMAKAEGIGQPSTRGVIIEELINSGYMESRTKANLLYITPLGERYMDSIKTFTISDPMQAAEWESVFQGVKEGTITYKEAESQFIHYVNDFVKEVSLLDIQRIPGAGGVVEGIACPWCGGSLVKYRWGWGCSGMNTNGCRFSVNGGDGKVKEKDLCDLVTKGRTRVIPKIVRSSKNGNSYDAMLKLNPKGSQYSTSFEFPPRESTAASGGSRGGGAGRRTR